MRQLTFIGFLKRYLKELSGKNTSSIYALAREAESTIPRLREPLFLYSFYSGKKMELVGALKNMPNLKKHYSNVLNFDFSKEDAESILPAEYLKVFRTYNSFCKKSSADKHTKKLMKDKICKTSRQKLLSDYRIYSDNNINSGNWNSFMKHENLNALSLEKLRSIISYLDTK